MVRVVGWVWGAVRGALAAMALLAQAAGETVGEGSAAAGSAGADPVPTQSGARMDAETTALLLTGGKEN